MFNKNRSSVTRDDDDYQSFRELRVRFVFVSAFNCQSDNNKKVPTIFEQNETKTKRAIACVRRYATARARSTCSGWSSHRAGSQRPSWILQYIAILDTSNVYGGDFGKNSKTTYVVFARFLHCVEFVISQTHSQQNKQPNSIDWTTTRHPYRLCQANRHERTTTTPQDLGAAFDRSLLHDGELRLEIVIIESVCAFVLMRWICYYYRRIAKIEESKNRVGTWSFRAATLGTFWRSSCRRLSGPTGCPQFFDYKVEHESILNRSERRADQYDTLLHWKPFSFAFGIGVSFHLNFLICNRRVAWLSVA